MAIKKADYLIIGPGDFYTSLVPNFIVEGFKEAINESRAKIILVLNLTNKKGHTESWKVGDYVKNTEFYIGKPADLVLINNEKPSDLQIERYKKEEGIEVSIENDFKDSRAVEKPLLSHVFFTNDKGDTMKRSFIRHDSEKLSKAISEIIK